ncbi:hypothetical protein [Nocardia sp. R7R-8]|uniref:hypothetical protein n=1 Tax=Nocardia sp. R7R-8 TaxID=3459304 RepID=UPI00403DF51E
MSGDPVEESGQAVRQGFVQALQTAHTTAALLRGQGGQVRSRAESEQRMRHADAKEGRSSFEHWVRVVNAAEAAGHARELNTARVEEIRARVERGDQQHNLEQRRTQRQIERADADLTRRNMAGSLERRHSRELHDAKITAYQNRETRAEEIHELDVTYKELLIDIRRRAAGFSDTLTAHGDTGQAAASAAAFAAAKSAERLSPQNAAESDAYSERFAADTGNDYNHVVDATVVDVHHVEDSGARVYDPHLVDTSTGEDVDDLYPTAGAGWTSSVAIEDVIGLTEELALATHLSRQLAGLDGEVADSGVDEGSMISDAVEAAGLGGDNATPSMGFGLEAEVSTAAMSATPDPGLEP